MAESKIIVVMGATGAQGGGLARAILADKSGAFKVRAVTRNPQSEKARALAALGAEVVAGDSDKPESLLPAFKGAYGAYCVTNYWEVFSVEREQAQAKAQADAAKAAGVRHVIWSSLEDTRKWVPLSDNRMPTLQGKYKCPHFDSKGEMDAYFREKGLPLTIFLTSFYWENFIYFGMGPKPGPDGTLAFALNMGDRPLSGIAAEDIGRCALGIFKKGSEFIGKTVAIAGEHVTGAEMAATLTKVLGRTVKYNAVSNDVYRGFGFPGADDLGNMFQYYHDFNDYFCGIRDVKASRALNPELQNFETWAARNAKLIPLG
ncbi:MAG TPA: NmrA/HSCARG family protein [Candidatus Eisenbacteria bacterium]|nr:NmrA/HSCARG family protein [Candidatus Eisenbacteria bacterium]